MVDPNDRKASREPAKTNGGCRTCNVAIEDDHDDVRGWFLLHAHEHGGLDGAFFCSSSAGEDSRELTDAERMAAQAYLLGVRDAMRRMTRAVATIAADAERTVLASFMEWT